MLRRLRRIAPELRGVPPKQQQQGCHQEKVEGPRKRNVRRLVAPRVRRHLRERIAGGQVRTQRLAHLAHGGVRRQSVLERQSVVELSQLDVEGVRVLDDRLRRHGAALARRIDGG